MITTLTRGTAEQPPSERRSDFNRPVSKRVSIVLIERRPPESFRRGVEEEALELDVGVGTHASEDADDVLPGKLCLHVGAGELPAVRRLTCRHSRRSLSRRRR